MATDWSIEVEGMRTDDRFRFCSSSVGMNSRPTIMKVPAARAKTARAATTNGAGRATARLSQGS